MDSYEIFDNIFFVVCDLENHSLYIAQIVKNEKSLKKSI